MINCNTIRFLRIQGSLGSDRIKIPLLKQNENSQPSNYSRIYGSSNFLLFIFRYKVMNNHFCAIVLFANYASTNSKIETKK